MTEIDGATGGEGPVAGGGAAQSTHWSALAAMLVALVVASALSTGRMLDYAERQPYGPRRDALVNAVGQLDAIAREVGLDRPAVWVESALAQGVGQRWLAAVGSAVVSAIESAQEPGAGTGIDGSGPGKGDEGEAAVAPPPTATAPSPVSTVAAVATSGDSVRLPPTSVPTRTPSPTPPVTVGRRISPARPLRVLVAGDSFAEPLGYELTRFGTEDRMIAVELDFKIATGLVRPDYYDWPARLAERLARRPVPEVVVLIFGGNEDQNILVQEAGAGGDPDAERVVALMGTTAWEDEYRLRVGATLDLFAGLGTRVYWVGMPVMRDEMHAAVAVGINRAVEAEAAGRAWARFVDIRPLFAGPDGGFAVFLPNAAGELAEVRKDDGVHFTSAGTKWVAARLYAAMGTDWDLVPPPTPMPTPTGGPRSPRGPSLR